MFSGPEPDCRHIQTLGASGLPVRVPGAKGTSTSPGHLHQLWPGSVPGVRKGNWETKRMPGRRKEGRLLYLSLEETIWMENIENHRWGGIGDGRHGQEQLRKMVQNSGYQGTGQKWLRERKLLVLIVLTE